MKKGGRKGKITKQADPEPEEIEPADVNQFELGVVERDCCKQNFAFYDAEKKGFVERFELPMLLQMCGYNLPDEKISKLNAYLDEK